MFQVDLVDLAHDPQILFPHWTRRVGDASCGFAFGPPLPEYAQVLLCQSVPIKRPGVEAWHES
jgi:hypothetical protein